MHDSMIGARPCAKVFADALIGEAGRDESVVAVHAAMGGGTGLNHFEKFFADRTFDVGKGWWCVCVCVCVFTGGCLFSPPSAQGHRPFGPLVHSLVHSLVHRSIPPGVYSHSHSHIHIRNSQHIHCRRRRLNSISRLKPLATHCE